MNRNITKQSATRRWCIGLNRSANMKSVSFLVFAMTALILSRSAHADQSCTGTISAFYISSNGAAFVQPSFSPNWLQMCSQTTSWNGVDPQTCKSWIAMVMTLRVTQEAAIMRYAGDTPCASLPAYGAAPAPMYVMHYTP